MLKKHVFFLIKYVLNNMLSFVTLLRKKPSSFVSYNTNRKTNATFNHKLVSTPNITLETLATRCVRSEIRCFEAQRSNESISDTRENEHYLVSVCWTEGVRIVHRRERAWPNGMRQNMDKSRRTACDPVSHRFNIHFLQQAFGSFV